MQKNMLNITELNLNIRKPPVHQNKRLAHYRLLAICLSLIDVAVAFFITLTINRQLVGFIFPFFTCSISSYNRTVLSISTCKQLNDNIQFRKACNDARIVEKIL